MFDFMESIKHGALKGSAKIFDAKRKLSIGKGPPWINEGRLMLIQREYLDLIIAIKSIHK